MSFLFPFCVSTSEELQIVASNFILRLWPVYTRSKRDKTENKKETRQKKQKTREQEQNSE